MNKITKLLETFDVHVVSQLLEYKLLNVVVAFSALFKIFLSGL